MSDPSSQPDRPGAAEGSASGRDFIRTIIDADLASGRHTEVVTRFPPEPNGYLHIGHAKAICLSFGIAEDYGGRCHLRFDDTNPETEDPHYVEAIKADIRWLGFDWGEHEYHASDYFEQLHEWAIELINKGKAYVDDLDEQQIREYRGTVTEPGRASPHRDRSVHENLELFERMRSGELADGSHVLRAKIDMAHPNMKMRDPLMYRIRHSEHYRRGDRWCIYPFYDWAHGQSDAIEGITHSLCSLEFENNRELYDWFLDNLETAARPHQYEFARLNVDYTITSKRKLLHLVQESLVQGWDDPRMPTLAGLRRRGVPPQAIRRFCDLVGVAKAANRVDIGMLEFTIRDELNTRAPRVLCVLRPLEVVITNYPQGQVEELEAPYWPHDVPKEGSRALPFSGRLYIERDDFMEDPPRKFFRLAPGREVRLRYGYVIRCDEVVKDESGEAIQLRCSYDPDTRGGSTPDGRKIKGTIHWVSAEHAVPVKVRLYDRLFTVPEPGSDGDLTQDLNPESLVTLERCLAEPVLSAAEPGSHFQFERQGYFFVDPVDSTPGFPVFNRTVTLRDSWAKIAASEDTTKRTSPAPGAADRPSQQDGSRRRKKRSPVEVRRELRAAAPELAARFGRYQDELGLAIEDADVLTGDLELARFFEAAIEAGADPTRAAKWVVNEVLRLSRTGGLAALAFGGEQLGDLVARVDRGQLSARAGRQVLAIMAAEGGDPGEIIKQQGLIKSADRGAVGAILDALVAEHADKFEALRGGRDGLLGFFVGQVMRQTKGTADPQLVQELLRERIR